MSQFQSQMKLEPAGGREIDILPEAKKVYTFGSSQIEPHIEWEAMMARGKHAGLRVHYNETP
jgi:hypothetical protein